MEPPPPAVFDADGSVDFEALAKHLEPELKEMEHQGAQHRAAYSPSSVLTCAHRIRKTLDAVTKQAAINAKDDDPSTTSASWPRRAGPVAIAQAIVSAVGDAYLAESVARQISKQARKSRLNDRALMLSPRGQDASAAPPAATPQSSEGVAA